MSKLNFEGEGVIVIRLESHAAPILVLATQSQALLSSASNLVGGSPQKIKINHNKNRIE